MHKSVLHLNFEGKNQITKRMLGKKCNWKIFITSFLKKKASFWLVFSSENLSQAITDYEISKISVEVWYIKNTQVLCQITDFIEWQTILYEIVTTAHKVFLQNKLATTISLINGWWFHSQFLTYLLNVKLSSVPSGLKFLISWGSSNIPSSSE